MAVRLKKKKNWNWTPFWLLFVFVFCCIELVRVTTVNDNVPTKTQSFQILAISDKNDAVVRWVDGTLTEFPLSGVKVDTDVTDLKGSHIVVRYEPSNPNGTTNVMEVTK